MGLNCSQTLIHDKDGVLCLWLWKLIKPVTASFTREPNQTPHQPKFLWRLWHIYANVMCQTPTWSWNMNGFPNEDVRCICYKLGMAKLDTFRAQHDKVWNYQVMSRDGNEAGRGGVEGWGLHPRPAWYCLVPSPPRPAWWGKLSHLIPNPWGPTKPHPTP